MIKNPVIVSAKLSTDKLNTIFEAVQKKLGIIVPENITTATALIMAEVRVLTELNNSEKKDLVCFLLYKLIENESQEKWNTIDNAIKKIVPNIIDTLVDVAKRKINVKKRLREPMRFDFGIMNGFKTLFTCFGEKEQSIKKSKRF